MKKIGVIFFVILLCITWIILPGCQKSEVTGIDYSSDTVAVTGDSYEYEPVNMEVYGYVGDEPLYSYYLVCAYHAIIDDFIEEQPDYDPEMTLEERTEYRDEKLALIDEDSGKTNKILLQQEAITRTERMITLYTYGSDNGALISENRRNTISSKWQQYGMRYYNTIKESYPEVQSPDDAMKMITGCNVAETVSYMQIQAAASNSATILFYKQKCTNQDFETYYKSNINDFRVVKVRAVHVDDEATALKVQKLMEDRPEDIDNLAKVYNKDNYLAKVNGLVDVTSSCRLVPEEVRDWAYTQTADTVFDKTGKIEIVKATDGWYIVICDSICEYSDQEGNQIYKTVAEAYKSNLLEDHIDWILQMENYRLNNVDYTKAYAVMESVF